MSYIVSFGFVLVFTPCTKWFENVQNVDAVQGNIAETVQLEKTKIRWRRLYEI